MYRRSLLAIGLAGLLVLSGCAGQATPAANDASAGAAAGAATGASAQATNDGGTIEVSGAGSAEAEPNRAVVRVAVTTTAPDAATARQRLAENVSRMRSALDDLDLDDGQITTTRYDLDRDYRRPRSEGDEPEIQYRAYHGFEITLSEIDRVGTVIDTAVQNGANNVEDIRFTLSSTRRRELQRSARSAAMADARQTAEQLADSANLTITGVKAIRTVDGSSPRPYQEAATAAPTATPADGADTEVDAGPVTVVTRVHVVYKTAPDGDE